MNQLIKIMILSLLIELTIFVSIVRGQGYQPNLPEVIPNTIYTDVDTANVPLLTQYADSISNRDHPEICYFLVQKGLPNIGPKIKAGILAGISKHTDNCDWYISGLYKLHDPETLYYTSMILDTIVKQKYQEGMYWNEDLIIDLISVTVYYGDLSRYQLLIDLLNNTTRVKQGSNLNVLESYANFPSKNSDAFADLKKFVVHPFEGYRKRAVKATRIFKDYPGERELLQNAAMNDSSIEVRLEAIYWLNEQYKDFFIFDAFKKTLIETASEKDTSDFKATIGFELGIISSPYVYAMMRQVQFLLPDGYFRHR